MSSQLWWGLYRLSCALCFGWNSRCQVGLTLEALDQSLLPFTAVFGVMEFVRFASLAPCFLLAVDLGPLCFWRLSVSSICHSTASAFILLVLGAPVLSDKVGWCGSQEMTRVTAGWSHSGEGARGGQCTPASHPAWHSG